MSISVIDSNTKSDLRTIPLPSFVEKYQDANTASLAKGGGNYYENYQLLCSSCNRVKGARPMEYLRAKIKTREKYIKKIQFGE